MKPYFLLSALALALVGCASSAGRVEAPGPGAQTTGLNSQQARITDTRILGDRQTMESLQDRLRKLNESGISQGNYPLAKAQCWLDTAKTQYQENDRTGYIEESLTESAAIIEMLEKDKATRTGFDTPLVARSTKLRDDLWSQLAGFKNNSATLACNARTVACAEVRLVRAGHAEQQTGWRAAVPHVKMAEDGVRRAGQEAAACAPVAAASAAPATGVAGTAAPTATAAPAPAAAVSRETFVILADTLFKFDKSGRDQMLPGGAERLSAVVNRLKAYQSIQTLSIVGHTDRLGGEDYNNKLSAARASTVRAYLESLGVKAATANALGKGEREPVTKNCSDKQSRADLISCLQPDRRVTIEVTGFIK
jgi:OmpA-OmpF porin, OOP family